MIQATRVRDLPYSTGCRRLHRQGDKRIRGLMPEASEHVVISKVPDHDVHEMPPMEDDDKVQILTADAATVVTMGRYHIERLSVCHHLLMRTAVCDRYAGATRFPLGGVRSASDADDIMRQRRGRPLLPTNGIDIAQL